MGKSLSLVQILILRASVFLFFFSIVIFFSYEGTGRSLSLKLLQQLRKQAAPAGSNSDKNSQASIGRSLHEVSNLVP